MIAYFAAIAVEAVLALVALGLAPELAPLVEDIRNWLRSLVVPARVVAGTARRMPPGVENPADAGGAPDDGEACPGQPESGAVPEPAYTGRHSTGPSLTPADAAEEIMRLNERADEISAEWHDPDGPVPGRMLDRWARESELLNTTEFAALDERVDALMPRPRGEHPYPPARLPVYGEVPQLEVDRARAQAAGERDRGRIREAMATRDPDLLRQVLDGLRAWNPEVTS